MLIFTLAISVLFVPALNIWIWLNSPYTDSHVQKRMQNHEYYSLKHPDFGPVTVVPIIPGRCDVLCILLYIQHLCRRGGISMATIVLTAYCQERRVSLNLRTTFQTQCSAPLFLQCMQHTAPFVKRYGSKSTTTK